VPANATPTSSPVASAAAPTLEPALKVAWEIGGPAPSQPCTGNPVVARDGNVWVSVCWDNRFWVFSPDGKYLETWGTPGKGDGQFDFIWSGGQDSFGGVAFAADGSFYTIEGGAKRVQHFDAKRHFLASWGGFGTETGQFVKPSAIGVDRQGNVYVGDGARDDVQVFAGDGTYLRTIAKDWGATRGCSTAFMTVTPDGTVLLSNDGGHAYSSDGQHLADFKLPAGSRKSAGIAAASSGDVFLMGGSACGTGSRSATIEFAPDGRLLHAWPPSSEMLAFGSSPRFFYGTDPNWAFIRRFDLPGA
jgi:hypothetical protein